jgi:hypothetical protein
MDWFFNNSGRLTQLSYSMAGKKFTNFMIEKTGGEIFTAGPTISTLSREADLLFAHHGLMAGANYLVEGVKDATDEQLDANQDFLIKTLKEFSTVQPTTRQVAVKLTAFIKMDPVLRFNTAKLNMKKKYFYPSQGKDGLVEK